MLSRIYKLIFISFLIYILSVNTICFVTTLNPKALLNPFYVKTRTTSVFLLVKYILTDIGIIIRKTSKDEIDKIIDKTAIKYGVDPELVKAVIEVESKYNEFAISRTGAIGLMQVMPATFFEMGFTRPFNYMENIEAGTKYLSIQLKRFNDLQLALSAYNAGPQNVLKKMSVPDFIETKTYIKKILEIYPTKNEQN
ncbi:lytic transglycosylase domain-containing protein [Deferribacterales bacterium Es71-Z0220]|uniref:lytic transglycosylase domain-containing protein n=1 Tax=Deferrivibrio essentukiensis TaxID=2880922 RepID=UPI001F60238C|nr:lytic transglycosylase domain-containing protein [Deferrivibrio essentukiensis]MCB4204909.1 lytic transglycosylase domain-containing protein [Deferrivibrio essentukiensis]